MMQKKTTLATIGITTSKCIKATGFTSKIISDKQTYNGISEAIINYYETKNISI
jgi:uroporphyrinogen-III synthase